MSFVSFSFLILFSLALTVRLTLGRGRREGVYLGWLLVSSLVFYTWHLPAYLLILLASTVVDFLAGQRLAALAAGDRRRRVLLVLSITVNLGLLVFFKYYDFFLDVFAAALPALHLERGLPPRLDVVLPIGISFYTFQSMSYTIDIYRGQLRPITSFWRFLLFVSFFPQLVAGPIVRAREFLYQLKRRRRPWLRVWSEGIYLLIRGFFLKMVLADNLAPVVDRFWSWSSGPEAGASDTLALVFLFSCQIFCDFAGYSSIARGAAYLLGFRLPVNFKSPYVAASFSEFWTRWHISLSRWLRDYLYIPLGGNRISPGRTYLNLAVVMLLGGLWHGADLKFLVWGGLHGAALAVERFFGLQKSGRLPGFRWLWFLIVQFFVLVAWVFFRAQDAGEATAILRNFSGLGGGFRQPEILIALFFTTPVVGMHLYTFLVERSLLPPPGPLFKAVVSGVMLYFVVTCYGTSDAFIYFQF